MKLLKHYLVLVLVIALILTSFLMNATTGLGITGVSLTQTATSESSRFVKFSDNFDQDFVGATPANWNCDFEGGAIEVTNQTALSNPNSLLIGDSNWANPRCFIDGLANSEYANISFRSLNQLNGGPHHVIGTYILLLDDSEKTIAHIRISANTFDNNCHIFATNDSEYYIHTYPDGSWNYAWSNEVEFLSYPDGSMEWVGLAIEFINYSHYQICWSYSSSSGLIELRRNNNTGGFCKLDLYVRVCGWAVFDDIEIEYYPIKNTHTGLGYSSIQAAINANETLNGHSIFVRNGTYHEDVVVNQSVSIIGENRDTTILHREFMMGPIFEVLSNNVTISGFTMRWAYHGILARSTNNLFSNNLIVAMDVYGISFSGGGFSTIANNTIINAGHSIGPGGGIELFGANNVLVSDNLVTNSYHGLRLRYADNNLINHNNLTLNNIGLGIWFSYNNTSKDNLIANSSDSGIHLTANSNIFIDNDLIYNNISIQLGVGVRGGNVIYHNNFVDSTYQVYFQDGSQENFWDNGCEGNYWSNYNGTDLDGDGICDTYLPWEGVDKYPLMKLYWIPSDINHDLKVDIRDVATAALAFGSNPGHPKWNPHTDITGPTPLEPDGKVDIRDIGLIAINYGKEWSNP